MELERSGELRPNENASQHTVLTKIKLFALKNHYPDFWDLSRLISSVLKILNNSLRVFQLL